MNVILSKTNDRCEKDMNSAYFEFMHTHMPLDPKLVHVDADLVMSLFGMNVMTMLQEHYGQIIDCGIQEANAVGVACGLSATGLNPFVHSFAPFMTRRACDQIFISGCYSQANVKIIGSDPGVMAAFNGGTHMPFEDMAIMRSFPGMTVLEPADPICARQVLEEIYQKPGMFYIRLVRKNVAKLYEEGTTIEIGKGNIIKEGTDVTIIACGILVEEGIKAVNLLKAEGISARLVDMFTIKPLDTELVGKCAAETGGIVTAENHSVIGGLGDAVLSAVMDTTLVPVEKVGVKDRFGQVGDVHFLKEEYGLTAEAIVAAAKRVIAKK